jgi:hypothetical protein
MMWLVLCGESTGLLCGAGTGRAAKLWRLGRPTVRSLNLSVLLVHHFSDNIGHESDELAQRGTRLARRGLFDGTMNKVGFRRSSSAEHIHIQKRPKWSRKCVHVYLKGNERVSFGLSLSFQLAALLDSSQEILVKLVDITVLE